MKIVDYKITSQFHCCSVVRAQCVDGEQGRLMPSSFTHAWWSLQAPLCFVQTCVHPAHGTLTCRKEMAGKYMWEITHFRFMSNF